MFTGAGQVYTPPTLWSLASVRSGLLVRVVWGLAITENTFPHPMVRVLCWQARRQASIQGLETNHGCQMASTHLCFTCGGQVGLRADLQAHNSAAEGGQSCAGQGLREGTALTPHPRGTLSTLLKSCLFSFSKMYVQTLPRNTTLPGLSLCPCTFKKNSSECFTHTAETCTHRGTGWVEIPQGKDAYWNRAITDFSAVRKQPVLVVMRMRMTMMAILSLRQPRSPYGSELKPSLLPDSAGEPQKIIKVFSEKLLSLWHKPGALTCIAWGLFLDPLENECVWERVGEKEQRENGLNHNNFIKQSFLVIFFGNVELKIDLQSKWA